MDEKTKELVAIGASVATNCQPCLTHHVDKADELGISEQDIREALAIGTQVQKGGMNAMQRFIEQSFDEKVNAGEKTIQGASLNFLTGNAAPGSVECCPGGGCC